MLAIWLTVLAVVSIIPYLLTAYLHAGSIVQGIAIGAGALITVSTAINSSSWLSGVLRDLALIVLVFRMSGASHGAEASDRPNDYADSSAAAQGISGSVLGAVGAGLAGIGAIFGAAGSVIGAAFDSSGGGQGGSDPSGGGSSGDGGSSSSSSG